MLAIKSSGADIIGSYSLEMISRSSSAVAAARRDAFVVVGSAPRSTTGSFSASPDWRQDTIVVAGYAIDSRSRSEGIRQTLHRGFKNLQPDQKQRLDPMMRSASRCVPINKADSTDPGKIREATLSTGGYKGAEGEYNFDESATGCTDTLPPAARRGPSFSTSMSNSRPTGRTVSVTPFSAADNQVRGDEFSRDQRLCVDSACSVVLAEGPSRTVS